MKKRELKSISDEDLFYLLYEDKETARLAFEELYSRFAPKIYTYCKRILQSDELAEDIFQETFLRFYESSKTERVMTNVSAYIFRIARNLCLNEKQRKYHSFGQFEELNYITENDFQERKDKINLVDSAIKLLPDKYREVLVLKEFLGFSYNEIADLLNTTLPSVRINIFRAKQKLREILAPYIEDFKK